MFAYEQQLHHIGMIIQAGYTKLATSAINQIWNEPIPTSVIDDSNLPFIMAIEGMKMVAAQRFLARHRLRKSIGMEREKKRIVEVLKNGGMKRFDGKGRKVPENFMKILNMMTHLNGEEDYKRVPGAQMKGILVSKGLQNKPFSVLLLLLFFSVSHQQAPAQYYGINIPIAVGEPQSSRKIAAFGKFHEEFTHCGKTTVENLNPGFVTKENPKFSSHVEIYVDCEPTPSRITLTQETGGGFGDFKRDFRKECEMMVCSDKDYPAKGDNLGKTSNMNKDTTTEIMAPAPEKSNVLVCESKQVEWPTTASTSSVLLANEENCYSMDGSLSGTLERGKTKWHQIPRWLPAGEETFNLRPFLFADERSEYLERVPFIFPHQTASGVSYTKCETACDRGTVVKLTMFPASYQSMIYVQPEKCTSFRICYDPDGFNDDTRTPTCNSDFTIDVLFHNGVIVWGKKGRASMIDMMSHRHQGLVAIEFGYGVTSQGDPTKTRPEFYFGNDHREFVTSDSTGYQAESAAKLTFFFPSDDCLVPHAGIFSKVCCSREKTTTTQEPIIDIIATTTPKAPRVLPNVRVDPSDVEGLSRAVYVQGKWWTWGVYFGFLSGTLLTLAIGESIFYLFKRTVFAVWYRGMYKRYGCDVSGVTGGLTGVGFGNTTSGVETIAAGATGNTMGVTGGATTTGATTGDGQTGTSTVGSVMGTTSNTNNSIAM
uniref:CUB domain-containing protein n=1 Tax=Caenorhabditis tropicalis TaxID=1561998 RepID=A0A1I7UPE9_9PELO